MNKMSNAPASRALGLVGTQLAAPQLEVIAT